ncbi:enterochelin esterase [Chloroflexia bacterium SDU3-3]|nr:enterochelin esterase [Chloroflexia bacterium SDU3-3]
MTTQAPQSPSDRRTRPLPVAASQRIAALAHALAQGDADALAEFWREAEAHGTPLVEPAPDGSGDCIATFLWRDGAAGAEGALVLLHTVTDSARDDLRQSMMERIPGSDVWHRSFRLGAAFHATYQLLPLAGAYAAFDPLAHGRRPEWLRIMAAAAPDPLCLRRFPNTQEQRQPMSVAAMPQAPLPPLDLAGGGCERHRFASAALGNQRDVWAYLPKGAAPRGLLVLFDGEVWEPRMRLSALLDHMIAAGRIPPLAVLMLDSIDAEARGRELPCNPQLARMLGEELLPWAAARWPQLAFGPERTVVSGQSYGGLASLYLGLHAPHLFGHALAQSASLWWPGEALPGREPGWLAREIAQVAPPTRFLITVGQREWMLAEPARELRDALAAVGRPALYREYDGGHDYLCWMGGLERGLTELCAGW